MWFPSIVVLLAFHGTVAENDTIAVITAHLRCASPHNWLPVGFRVEVNHCSEEGFCPSKPITNTTVSGIKNAGKLDLLFAYQKHRFRPLFLTIKSSCDGTGGKPKVIEDLQPTWMVGGAPLNYPNGTAIWGVPTEHYELGEIVI